MAYICPMDVLLEDIKHTLKANRVCLPGSAEDLADRAARQSQSSSAALLIEAGSHNANVANFNDLTVNDHSASPPSTSAAAAAAAAAAVASSSSSSKPLPRNVQGIHAAGRLDSISISQ